MQERPAEQAARRTSFFVLIVLFVVEPVFAGFAAAQIRPASTTAPLSEPSTSRTYARATSATGVARSITCAGAPYFFIVSSTAPGLTTFTRRPRGISVAAERTNPSS